MDANERAQIVEEVGEPWHRIDFAARKKRAEELLGEGFSKRQIARYFDVSIWTITYWLTGRDRRIRKLQAARSAWSR